MKLISENYDFDRKFEICVKNFEDCDLYFNSTGFAYLKSFKTDKIIKMLIPDVRGRICLRGKRYNFKRELFKITYPHISLKNKVVVALGKSFNVLNLVAMTRNEFVNAKKHNKIIIKNQNTGQFFGQ